MTGNLLDRAERAQGGRRPAPSFAGLAPVIASGLLAFLASSMLASCASHTLPGTAALPATGSQTSVPGVQAADSLAARALAVAQAARLVPEDLAALAAGAPRVLPGGILFTYAERSAHTVFVAGTFNGWVPNQHELVRRRAADTLWVGFVPLPPRGRYVYKFLIDGRRWVVDPANPERGGDGAGGVASFVVVP